MAMPYNVSGVTNITFSGSAFINLFNQEIPDLILLNQNKSPTTRLFRNMPSAPFLDVTSSCNLFQIEKSLFTHFADINNDSQPDLITISPDSTSIKLNLDVRLLKISFPVIVIYFKLKRIG